MSTLTRALDTLLKIPPPKPENVTPTMEAMLTKLGEYGDVSLLRTNSLGWWAYLESCNGAATLKIKSEVKHGSPFDAVWDLYRKAAPILRYEI